MDAEGSKPQSFFPFSTAQHVACGGYARAQEQGNVKTVITLARLQGMIIGYAEAHGVKTHILLPSQWRKVLGYSQGPKVKRAELKQQSADYVKNKYGFVKSEDENEAIALNDAARKKLGLDDFWGD